MRPFRPQSLPLLLLFLVLVLPSSAQEQWIATWVASQQPTDPAGMKPALGLQGSTLRQIIQPTLAGSRLRITVSNQYGEKPLHISAARVARSLGGSSIDLSSDHEVLFNGQSSFSVLPGATLVSDEINLSVEAFSNLAVSLQLDSLPKRVSGHPGSRTTSFFQAGELAAQSALPDATTTDQWFLLSSVEVLSCRKAAAILAIGDSITDGRGSTTNANDRWPNLLARRLHASGKGSHLAVLNQGVGASRVLRDGVGDSILRRFDRDVLAVPGVRWLILFSGVNDLGGAHKLGAPEHREPIAKELIQAYRQLILRAHSHGIRVIGATIMPFEGFTDYDNPDSQAARAEVNTWIREGGAFDAVIDFDRLTCDPLHPARLSPAVDGGDHLHPSAAGYQLMAGGIDLSLFLD